MIGGRELVAMLADPRSGFAITPIIDADAQVGSASIDIRLGPDIIVSRRATGATSFDASDAHAFQAALRRRQTYVRRGIGDPFHLQPGEFAIARSLEYVQLPADVSAEALGRSSWGRLGLTIATATLIDPGFRGTITLELANVGNTPLVLEIGLRVAQLTFSRIESRSAGSATGSDDGRADGEEGDEERAKGDDGQAARIERANRWWDRARRRQPDSRYHGQMRPELSRLDRDPDLLWVSPMAVKYVVGVVGHRFAGKSTVVNFLTSRRGFRLYRLATFVYEEALRRGVDIGNHATLREVGNDMRERWGPDVLARMAFARIRSDYLDADHHRQPAMIVVEGFKVPEELAAWQRLVFYRTLLVDAPADERLRRARSARALDGLGASALGDDAEIDAWQAWWRQEVDEPADGRHHAKPVVDEAKGCDSTLVLDNRAQGLTAFEGRLREEVHRLEIWSRSIDL